MKEKYNFANGDILTRREEIEKHEDTILVYKQYYVIECMKRIGKGKFIIKSRCFYPVSSSPIPVSLPFPLYSFFSRVLRTWFRCRVAKKVGKREGNSCRIRSPSRQLLFRSMYFSLRFISLRIEFPISVCATT